MSHFAICVPTGFLFGVESPSAQADQLLALHYSGVIPSVKGVPEGCTAELLKTASNRVNFRKGDACSCS